MRRLAGLALALVAAPAAACDLPSALFVCGASGDSDGALTLCGPQGMEIGPDDPVQFIDDTAGGTGAIYPATPGSIQNFAFAHWWTEDGHYRAEVSWADAERHFLLFHEQSEENAAEMFADAGLIVTDDAGAELSHVRCGEVPHVYLHFMQQNMTCNLDNPHGEAACREQPAGPAPQN